MLPRRHAARAAELRVIPLQGGHHCAASLAPPTTG